MTESRADSRVRETLDELWEALSFIANALLFLFIGLALDFTLLGDNFDTIVLAIGAVVVARPIAVVATTWILERLRLVSRIGARNSTVLVWGGLGGGVALALALALPDEVPARDTIVAATGGVVLSTLLLNATTIRALVHWLGLDRISPSDLFLGAAARLLAIEAVRSRLAELDFQDEVLDAHLHLAEVEARDDLSRSHLSEGDEIQVLTLRGLHIERETYQRLSDAGLLPPIATRSLMYEIDDEIEEAQENALWVDAARRAHLPWYARLHRHILGLLPPPLGEDLVEVAYVEVSARRIAAQKAASELEHFRALPNVSDDQILAAKEIFTHWERTADARLDELETHGEIERRVLYRRQSLALSRITARELLQTLVTTGVISTAVADEAGDRITADLGDG